MATNRKRVPPFIIVRGNRELVHPAKLAKYFQENVPYAIVRDSSRNTHQIYVYEHGVYKIYDKDKIMGVLKKFIEDYDDFLVNAAVLKEAVTLIFADTQNVPIDALDTDEDIINFQNGLLQITGRGLKLLPHNPKHLSTIQLPCEWTGKESPTPVFDQYLETLTNGNRAIQEFLLEYIGAVLSNVKGCRMKKSLFMVGPGDTGKSQLKALVEKLLGKGNYAALDLDTLEKRFGTGALYGSRLCGSSDMSFISVDELKTFKQVSPSGPPDETAHCVPYLPAGLCPLGTPLRKKHEKGKQKKVPRAKTSCNRTGIQNNKGKGNFNRTHNAESPPQQCPGSKNNPCR